MTVRHENQLIVLQPKGRLDLQGGKLLGEQLAHLAPQQHDLWVINLAQVDFMDSCGLVALVTALKLARQNHCRLVLCSVQASVRLVLELTHMDSVFEIFPSYEAIFTAIDAPLVAA